MLSDLNYEKAYLASLFKYSEEAYASTSFITEGSFSDQSNAILFTICKKIIDGGNKPDLASILSTAKDMGFEKAFSSKEDLTYIRAIANYPANIANVEMYAAKLKKIEIINDIATTCEAIKKDAQKLNGSEPVSTIVDLIDAPLNKIINGIFSSETDKPVRLFEDMEDYIYEVLENPDKFSGHKTGFPAYDEAIGGGLRRGGVDVIAARPKAQPLNSKVLTPSGWKLMGEIKVGDLICSPDGDYSTVEKIHKHGIKKVFKFTFSDGTECNATEDHLWKIKNRRKKEWSVLSYKDIEKHGLYESDRAKWQLPLTEPVIFYENNHLIHPYVLGILLGDGCLSKSASFSNVSEFIKEKVASLIPKECVVTNHGSKGMKSIVKSKINFGKNTVLEELKRINLYGKLSHDKFIPKEYLFDSIDNRINLLNGLLDTDGSISGSIIEYSTVSEKLKDDIIFLVRSLGGKCTWIKRKTSYDKITFFNSFRLYISFNDNTIVFTKPDKLSKAKKRTKPDLKRNLISVEYIGEEECQCITVSNKDGLYITDDFVVTHNCGKSSFGLQIGLNLANKNIPVLIVDTEMTVPGQKNRAIANQSMINVNEFTSGEIKRKQEKLNKIIKTAQDKQGLPIYHINVSGKEFKSILAIISQWIRSVVGRDENGKTNDCLIVYDYLKLTTSEDLGKNTQEYQALGFQMTSLYNAMVKYDCPCLAFVQLNRDMEASQSDRIVWLCTSFTKFLLKSPEEMAEDIEKGVNPPYNRKLEVAQSRFGPGTEFGNYINVRMRGQFAKLDPGPTRNEVEDGELEIQVPDILTVGNDTDTAIDDEG